MSNFERSRAAMPPKAAWTMCLILLAACAADRSTIAAEPATARKIVFLAGTVHQGPGGHPAGTHEYELSARLLKHALETAGNVSGVKAEVHVDGWPRDPKTLDDADTIVVLSDGADRNEQDHPLLVGDRLQTLKRQMDRGCGLVAMHWTVFVPRKHGGDEFLEWIGGHFDYESGNTPNKWNSKIQTATTTSKPATAGHPICRGVAPFKLREEYYYNMRFRPNDPRLVPILSTPIPGEAGEQVVAWAVERAGGGRGFGFTGGHFFDNWGVEEFRRMVLNAILWTAHVEVPDGGVTSAAPTTAETAVGADDKPIQALIVTGHQHPAHVWRDTTVALQEALAADRRCQITVVTDPEFLATKNLLGFDVVLLNYCNWQREGLSDEAKANFQKYLTGGGGLVIVHFTNGAFHASLPETPRSDWPEFRNICRRVWDHAPGKSGHDPFGRFTVEIAGRHPITEGMNSFETIDELYFNQQGDQPIEVLATAHWAVTKRDEPMAFVYSYGKGRVFQTVLGHAAESIRAPGEAALLRRGAVWAAGRPQRAVLAPPAKVSTAAPKLVPEGRFGAALDPRAGAAWAARKDIYDKRPLTVECWARLNGKAGFNILVANNSKESAEHWELYSYAGAGDLSLYLPGFAPAEIRSGVDITDGRWHYLAASFDVRQVRLYVDGRMVNEAPIMRKRSGGPTAALYFGGYPPHGIGCDGLVDDVRISRVLRTIERTPSSPLVADEDTLGLWHFDRVENSTVEDASSAKNPAVTSLMASSGPMLARHVADPGLKLLSIDTSPDESFFSMRVDTTGRLFVGGREALFVYEPDDHGGYKPRQLLYRFGPDTWLTDVEVRGDDLYVMTNAALYLFPRGRIERENLKPRRLLWGTPVDLHVTWHGLAWGPEGDLYFSSGDPLLNYGDFRNRPDHFGHWTIYSQPEGTKVPYTGVGGFFRCKPDGSDLQVVAGGTRGAVGIAFDRRWNLFSNDNDHESIAERYSPARLLHVAPRANFFWPRGWMAAMSPQRSDLLEIVNSGMGREAPVGQAYYDEPWLGPRYRDSLLVARWGQRKVDGFALAPRGATFQAVEFPLLVGAETARPVGVTVGRGGRIFAALSYMAANEWSPKYPSEIVMITRGDDRPTHPFEAYEAPTAEPARLWSELGADSCLRRQQAHQEILRRGGPLLIEAIARLKSADSREPAMMHLPWLAAASGQAEARDELVARTQDRNPEVRAQAIRALGEFRQFQVPDDVLIKPLSDTNLVVRHAAVVAMGNRNVPFTEEFFSGPACSADTYLRQASAFLLAQRATNIELDRMLASNDAAQRLAGVLAVGFRLTVPPANYVPPNELELRYESQNALFVVPYADETVELKKLGRVGSFTIAERWRAATPSEEEQRLVEILIDRLPDGDERVSVQAGYFLSLLDDTRANRLVAEARRSRALERLRSAARVELKKVWVIGPIAAGTAAAETGHSVEAGAIDLSAGVVADGAKLEWREADVARGIEVPTASAPMKRASSYFYFRLQSLQPETAVLSCGDDARIKLWHNGREVESLGPFVLSLEPGSNDLLLRLGHGGQQRPFGIEIRSAGRIESTLPEKVEPSALAERLRSAGAGNEGTATAGVPPEFLSIDWASAAKTGDAERGRRLFGVDTLGCAKCHAILPNQKGGGGPSLAGAASRFTVAHLVESILIPGRQVAPVFGTTSIATDDGKSVAGLVVEEDEKEIVLLLPTAVRQVVSKSRIEDRRLQPTSPMPSALVKTTDELRDLLAYLLSSDPRAP